MNSPARPPRTAAHLAVLFAFVLLIRLPFIAQAIGGDDVYYLAAAYHGLIEPLHPNHTWYVFNGVNVNFQGYPHPPGNAWFLTGLLAIFKNVEEIPFHGAYIAFSLITISAMYALGRRFSTRPLACSLLFAVVPAFFVNGNLLESDVPLTAFWLAGAAAFIYAVDRGSDRLLVLAAICLALTGLIAMQAVVFAPILLAYLWLGRKGSPKWVLTACAPIFMLTAWQLFERLTSGVFPFVVSAGYLNSYGYERIPMKVRNALSLLINGCFLIFPLLIPFAVSKAWKRRRDASTQFLVLWIAIFFAAACVLFYDGSARYLLPLAAPAVILFAAAPLRWVGAATAIQLVISLSLAIVNFQHWNAYRQFAEATQGQFSGKRVWVDAEWGLRHYLEAEGALPVHRDQWIPNRDIVVESELAFPPPFAHGGRSLEPVAQAEIRPWLPLRLIGIDAKSGYSSNSEGFLPYDFRGGRIDRITAVELRAQEPTSSHLLMNAAEAESQILYGLYPAEGQTWRWSAGAGAFLLKSTGRPSTLQMKIYISDAAPARSVTVSVEGGPRVTRHFVGPGSYTISLAVDTSHLSPVIVRFSVDHTFSAPGDIRQLGVIINEIALE